MAKSQTSTIPMPSSDSSSQQPTSQTPPDITSVKRVVEIPLINATLRYVDEKLNTYTPTPYHTAKDLSISLVSYTQPVQIQLAGLIVRADNLANQGLDVVQARIPSAFETKPEDITSYVREKRESASEFVNQRRATFSKAIDANVKSPAFAVVEGIDQRCAPVVDVFESVVKKINGEGKTSTTPVDSKYQYQRAYVLSRDLGNNLYEVSTEQLKQIQAQSVLVQSATEKAQLISKAATDSRDLIIAMSNQMLTELKKLQTSTAQLASTTYQTSATQLNQLPPQIQRYYTEISSGLNSAITDLSAIAKEDLPLQEKVGKLSNEVKDKVMPLLDAFSQTLSSWTRSSQQQQEKPLANGH